MNEETRKACARYTGELFAPEDEVLADLRREMAEAHLPAISIDAEEGKLLQVLLRAIGARRVIELGTLGGYSAIWMGRALPLDGLLISIEWEADRAALARRYIARAGLADRVRVRVGLAREVLADLAADGPYDAVFIDADKESYPSYLDWCSENIRGGGLVIADNAFRKGQVLDQDTGDPAILGIQEFNRRLATDPRFVSIVVPTRDGMAIALVDGR